MSGFFQSQRVQVALAAGAIAAAVSGVVGVFVVIRGQSFAGHALGDLGTLGGSAAFLGAVNPLWGFVGAGAAVAGLMELLGVQRRRGRGAATGIVLGAALGVSALLLYLDTTSTSTTGATVTVLFGSLFTVSSGTVAPMAALAAAGVVGTILSPALLIGPAATALRLSRRTAIAMALALATIWASIAAAYVTNWPIGFYVGVFGATWYILGRIWSAVHG